MEGKIPFHSTITSNRCRFCKEFMTENEDIAHLICDHCWKEINKVFVVTKIKI